MWSIIFFALRALEALRDGSGEQQTEKASRALKDAPGKWVDRWVAVLGAAGVGRSL